MIEDVTLEDSEEILKIYAPYVEKTAVSFEYEIPSLSEFQNRIENISAKYPYIKYVDHNNKILGYAYASAFHSRKAYEWSAETTIYLKQDCRGQGIGRALYQELEKRLKDMGILNMNACIAVPKIEDEYLTNASVLFHKKMGFTSVGTFHNSGYKFQRWYDMIWLEKIIGEHQELQPPVVFK